MKQINKTSSEVIQEYIPKWTVVDQILNTLLESGESDLSRIVNLLDKGFLIGGDNPERQNKYRLMQTQTSFILNNQVVKRNGMDFFDIVSISDAARIGPILKCCKSDNYRVVELAAGWGKNLFNIFLKGGPKDGRYYAFDINEIALSTARRICDAATNVPNLVTEIFDLQRPDFSSLEEPQPTVLFTNYGLEQIAIIDPNLINAIARIPDLRYCVHVEPIGWQIPDSSTIPLSVSWCRRKMRERQQRIINDNVKHNMNLFSLLRSFENRGVIKIETIRKHIACPHGWNPASLVIWRPVHVSN